MIVSVLMTAFNREEFIAEAIESVLTSSYKNFELIVIDDFSTDNTVSIAQKYAKLDNRLRVIKNEKNLGQFANRNKAVSLASGEYIITVDSDDMIFDYSIEYLLKSMIEYPEASFAIRCTTQEHNVCLLSEEAIRNHFFKSPYLMHGPGATVIKKSFFDFIGGYPVEYGVPGDMYFNLNATCNSNIILLSKEFMFYRRHEGQEINNSYDYLINNYRYLRDALLNIPFKLSSKEILFLNNKNKRRFLVNIFKYFFKTFNITKTTYALKKTSFGLHDAFAGLFH